MGQCRTLDADVTIGCYYGDCSSRDNTIPMSFVLGTNFLPSHLIKKKKTILYRHNSVTLIVIDSVTVPFSFKSS